MLVDACLSLWFSYCQNCVLKMALTLLQLCVVLAAVFGVIVYRMTVSALLFAVKQDQISQWSSTITSITAACINLICIIFLGRVSTLQTFLYALSASLFPIITKFRSGSILESLLLVCLSCWTMYNQILGKNICLLLSWSRSQWEVSSSKNGCSYLKYYWTPVLAW